MLEADRCTLFLAGELHSAVEANGAGPPTSAPTDNDEQEQRYLWAMLSDIDQPDVEDPTALHGTASNASSPASATRRTLDSPRTRRHSIGDRRRTAAHQLAATPGRGDGSDKAEAADLSSPMARRNKSGLALHTHGGSAHALRACGGSEYSLRDAAAASGSGSAALMGADESASGNVEDSVELRVPFGKGIAGHVAKTMETLNIKEAYEDARFNEAVDQRTGYRTRALLCMPIISSHGHLLGVTQMINKKSPTGAKDFSAEDERLLRSVCNLIAVSLENSLLFRRTQSICERVASFTQHSTWESAVPEVCATLRELLGVEVATLYLPRDELSADDDDDDDDDGTGPRTSATRRTTRGPAPIPTHRRFATLLFGAGEEADAVAGEGGNMDMQLARLGTLLVKLKT